MIEERIIDTNQILTSSLSKTSHCVIKPTMDHNLIQLGLFTSQLTAN